MGRRRGGLWVKLKCMKCTDLPRPLELAPNKKCGVAEWRKRVCGWGQCRITCGLDLSCVLQGQMNCWHCGGSGHSQRDCQALSAGQVKKCFVCGGTDHLAPNCEQNPNKAELHSQQERGSPHCT
eukprot:3847089-Amphidinium_carterae.1